ncbi:MAG: rod shape-determining protein MreD [Gammaproteobacteria bacterium]|nr:MAG: rod shape-determining protein MreD [Gammaproteobacteria bacterium]
MTRTTPWYKIQLTLLLAFALTLLPVSEALKPIWPQWLVIVICYWTLAHPDRFGLRSAWLWGLLTDVAMGTYLGIHALSLSLVAYVSLTSYQRIRMYTIWQQSLYVWLIASLDKLVVIQLENALGQVTLPEWYWFPPIITGFLWNPAAWLIQKYRQLGQVAHRRYN